MRTKKSTTKKIHIVCCFHFLKWMLNDKVHSIHRTTQSQENWLFRFFHFCCYFIWLEIEINDDNYIGRTIQKKRQQITIIYAFREYYEQKRKKMRHTLKHDQKAHSNRPMESWRALSQHRNHFTLLWHKKRAHEMRTLLFIWLIQLCMIYSISLNAV